VREPIKHGFRDKWMLLQAAIEDDQLRQSDKVIFARLLDHRNYQTGMCFPSHKTLKDDCGMCEKTVGECIGRLRAQGWIITDQRHDDSLLFWFDWTRIGRKKSGRTWKNLPEIWKFFPEMWKNLPGGMEKTHHLTKGI
jgi:DNA-binding transcriptional MocR family regulator